MRAMAAMRSGCISHRQRQHGWMARVVTDAMHAIGYAEGAKGDGGGERTPIVFLHGVGSDKSVWRPQLEHFGSERRAIAFDYPGYGESDPAPEDTTRDDYAA